MSAPVPITTAMLVFQSARVEHPVYAQSTVRGLVVVPHLSKSGFLVCQWRGDAYVAKPLNPRPIRTLRRAKRVMWKLAELRDWNTVDLLEMTPLARKSLAQQTLAIIAECEGTHGRKNNGR